MNKPSSLAELLARLYPQISHAAWSMKPLAGLSGGTFLLTCKQKQIIARSQGDTQSHLYVNRQKERSILKQLVDFSAAPRTLGANTDWLLIEWLPGQHPDQQLFHSVDFQYKLAALIAALHHQPKLSYDLALQEEIIHYGQQIDKRRMSPRWLQIQRRFERATQPKSLKIAPAHMDIHRENLLITPSGELFLLDWEYSANTDIGLSLSTFFIANGLNDEQKHQFIMNYCVDFHAYRDPLDLAQQCKLWQPWVKYMMLMWYEVRWKQTEDHQFLTLAYPLREEFGLTN